MYINVKTILNIKEFYSNRTWEKFKDNETQKEKNYKEFMHIYRCVYEENTTAYGQNTY